MGRGVGVTEYTPNRIINVFKVFEIGSIYTIEFRTFEDLMEIIISFCWTYSAFLSAVGHYRRSEASKLEVMPMDDRHHFCVSFSRG